ncbi:MAG: extracellular solute-binding protein [Anaerolineae bacterium]
MGFLSRYMALICLVGLLTGCSLISELSPSASASPTPEPTLTPTVAISPTPEPTPSPGVRTTTLELWVPPFLNPYEPGAAGERLTSLVRTFSDSHRDIRVRMTVKKDTGPGGLYNLLSTAAEVAPGVLPDLLILNQHDLVLAGQEGLLSPVDDEMPPDAGYFPTALSSFQTAEATWGFPYVATADQMAYRQGITTTAPITFTTVLSGSYSFLFPAGQSEGMGPDMLLAMYIGLGGRVIDQSGQATLDRATLEQLYAFFSDMRKVGLLNSEQALGLTNTEAAWAAFLEGEGDLTPVSVGSFWAEPREDVLPSWVPTEDGAPITVLHTWGIAIVSTDPVRREAAVALMRWLVSAQNMAELARAANLVPTRELALSDWGTPPEGTEFLTQLLTHSVSSLPPSVDTAVRRALLAGVTALLQGQVETPQAAASQALTTLRR